MGEVAEDVVAVTSAVVLVPSDVDDDTIVELELGEVAEDDVAVTLAVVLVPSEVDDDTVVGLEVAEEDRKSVV